MTTRGIATTGQAHLGDAIQDLASRPRMRLRGDEAFCKYVQDRGGLDVLAAGTAPANDAQ
ncbi:hypothetical protein [Kibdelosporangium aridum]|uniref:hypothetical protein n=1 Tax=Kibdelosporangium aridum TaxID=2030 RepID=UPI000A775C5A|nr:hypothetical protein [Kibdelosporangium aridum]